MNTTAKIVLGMGLCLSVPAAQAQHLNFKPMNFDIWCQEHMHLPPSRCDKRLPDDDAAYQAYANKIENYETQQQNQDAQGRRIDRALQNGDPSANPSGTPQAPTVTPH